jgi:hypothetical protein
MDGVEMSFTIMHRYGAMETGALSMLEDLVAELDGPSDHEHPDVAVEHVESGWVISAFQSGRLVCEQAEGDRQPRHLVGAARSQVLQVFNHVAQGEIELVKALDWRPGYG